MNAFKPETVEAIRKAYPDMDSILNDPQFDSYVEAYIDRLEKNRRHARNKIRLNASEKMYHMSVQFKRTPLDWFLESLYCKSTKALIDAFNQIAQKRGGFTRSQREVITSIVHAAAKELVNSKAKDHEAANVIRATVARTKRAPSGSKGQVCHP